jgi:anti-sigma B factor antagonist
MEGSIDVATVRLGDVPVVTVAGEIDVTSAPTLREALEAQTGEGVGVVVVDLRQVSFLDSTALGVLVAAHKERREHDGELRLAVDEPRILKVFEITGLVDVFRIAPTPEAALAG